MDTKFDLIQTILRFKHVSIKNYYSTRLYTNFTKHMLTNLTVFATSLIFSN